MSISLRRTAWSFRTRLTVTITGVFLLAGVALLTVVYLLVSSLFNRAIGASVTAAQPVGAATPYSVGAAQTLDLGGVLTPSVYLGQSSEASSDIDSLILGSGQNEQSGLVQTNDFLGAGGIMAVAVPAGQGFITQQAGATGQTISDIAIAPGGTVLVSEASPAARAITTWYTTKSENLAGSVLTGLLVWSGVALVVFALLAALAAWWLARRSLRRIGEVTRMAQDLSTHDLHRRLDLPGPADEIKDLGDTIDAMLNRLESAFASQDRFIANASHELRTPLTTSRTALEIPLSQGRVPEDLQPAFRTALRAGARTELLIDSLLALARGSAAPADEIVDLAGVLDTELESAADLAVDSGVDVDTGIVSDASFVAGDTTMFEQAIGNLIDNAVRHNHSGGWVRADLENVNGMVVLRVENTGPAVSSAELALLTEAFYRAGSSRTATTTRPGRGVGLGLSIVAKIAEAHRGELLLAARADGGLVATLTLPLASPTSAGRITPGAQLASAAR